MKASTFILILIWLAHRAFPQTECDNFNLVKGMYVDDFLRTMVNPYRESRADFDRSILGNPVKEKALLFYAEKNRINYLVLYGTTPIFRYGNQSTIGQGYTALLKDFISRANQRNIEIGLTFGPELRDFDEHVQLQGPPPVTPAIIAEHLNYDTLWPGWGVLRKLMDETPGHTINHDIYAMVGIYKMQRELKHSGDNRYTSTLTPGLKSIVTEYEWWNTNGTTTQQKHDLAKVKFRDKFLPLLQIIKTLKDKGSIERTEVYQGSFPGSDSDPVHLEQYKSWITQMTLYTDRILLANYTQYPDAIGSRTHLKLLMELFNSAANQNAYLELAPIFSWQTDKFLAADDGSNYEKFLGDVLSDGTSTGKSVQEIQGIFVKNYESLKSQGKVGTRFKLAGFQWFCYTLGPHMIYNTLAESDKYLATGKLNDKLRHYFTSNTPLTLEVYNSRRAPFGAGSADDAFGNSYQWHRTDPEFAGTPAKTGGSGPQLTVSEPGIYYVQTVKNGCTTISVPVLVDRVNTNLWFKDSEEQTETAPEPYTRADTWESPDLWVNQSADPNDATRGMPVADKDNYVHIRIRNRGSVASSGREQLSVYFSKASTGLQWPESWIRKMVSNELAGDRLNKTPIYIPSIEPDDSLTLVMKWDEINSLLDADATESYSLLARILRSENPPGHGMTFPETEVTRDNAANNSAIAWRNVSLIKIDDVQQSSEAEGWKLSRLLLSNDKTANTNIRLYFDLADANGQSILQAGKVMVNLGTDGYSKWQSGGKKGQGISLASFNINGSGPVSTISIDAENAWIGDISLPPGTNLEITVGVKMKSDAAAGDYHFVFRQKDILPDATEKLTGGGTFMVDYAGCPAPFVTATQQNSLYQLNCNTTQPVSRYRWYRNDSLIRDEEGAMLQASVAGTYRVNVAYATGCTAFSDTFSVIISRNNNGTGMKGAPETPPEITVYPNPARGVIFVELPGATEAIVIIQIFDAAGREFLSLEAAVDQDKGRPLEVPVHALQSGQYMVRVTLGKHIFTRPINIER